MSGPEVPEQPLTPADEFELYVTKGIVPSMYAVRRALGDDRGDVLARLDRRETVDSPARSGVEQFGSSAGS